MCSPFRRQRGRHGRRRDPRSLSATASYSPEYNYLGDTESSLDLNQTELILNGTKRFDNGLKLAAQIYAYELAGYEDLTVDFANLDYSFRPSIGVRVGRNKLPVGFYNEVQDLDQVRVFASLPLNFYPRAGRSFGASYDGAAIYGNVSLGKAGALDYQLYYGVIQALDEEMPFMKGLGTSLVDVNEVYGFGTSWSTPVEGLRIGYSYQIVPKVDMVAGPAIIEVDYSANVLSAEYSFGNWIASAEYKHTSSESVITNFPVPPGKGDEDHAYVQLSYQVTDDLGLGVYYAYTEYSAKGVVKDAALAASYAIEPWWLVKAEVHAIDGIGALGDAGDINPGANDETWTYFVLKTTLSF
jgi:hypothetical protein